MSGPPATPQGSGLDVGRRVARTDHSFPIAVESSRLQSWVERAVNLVPSICFFSRSQGQHQASASENKGTGGEGISEDRSPPGLIRSRINAKQITRSPGRGDDVKLVSAFLPRRGAAGGMGEAAALWLCLVLDRPIHSTV